MVDHHGSQCGFCTPGLRDGAVRAAITAPTRARSTAQRGERLDRRQSLPLHRLPADRRCGACRPARSRRTTGSRREEPAARQRARRAEGRRATSSSAPRSASSPRRPGSTSLAKLYYANPDATLVAGATDVGLWITKQLRDLPKIIWLGRVKGLDEIEDRRDAVSFGAMVTHAEAMPYLAAIDRDLGELMRRFAGTQVRMAGNGRRQHRQRLADRRPAARADRARRDARAAARPTAPRTLPLENFFLDYGKQDRAAGRVRARGARAEVRRRTSISAATRSPSASTATFPP